MASLDIAIALLPAAHAVEEIARVQGRAVLAFRISRLDRGVTTRPIFAAERPVERRERGEHFVAGIFRDDFVTVPRQVERALRAADLTHRKAKDILRASGLALLSVDNVHVAKDLDKVEIVGVFPNYATAYAAWKAKAQQTVDNAHMRYFIVHLHRLLDPAQDAKTAR